MAHLSPVRDSADLFLPAGEINPFRRQKGQGIEGEGDLREGREKLMLSRSTSERVACFHAGSRAEVKEAEAGRLRHAVKSPRSFRFLVLALASRAA